KGALKVFSLTQALPYPNPRTGRSIPPRTVMECASIPESLFGSFSSEKERFHTPAPKHNHKKRIIRK
ncbi:MAG: hypothetical protein J1E79_02805, partial [Rikenella sp.]|nr:hypothetical protein [Rikenella sp.]